MAKQLKKSTGWVIIIAVAVLAIVAGQASLSRQAAATSATPEQAAQRRHALLIHSTKAAGEKAIRALLKDPSSAVFSDVYALQKGSSYAACGSVNAKNSFGAMTGSTPWVVVPEESLVLIYFEDEGERFIDAWERHCINSVASDIPAPAEMFGVRWGASPPATLKPFDESRTVWTYKSDAPSELMGMAISQVSFVAEGGKIFGGSVQAKGRGSYDSFKATLIKMYGPPTSASDMGNLLNEWRWASGSGAVIRLHFEERFDQTSLYMAQKH
jgi:hypothetical protein